MSYFKGEVKTYVFANRRLKKSLMNTDKFLADLCEKIQIDHNKNNDTINNLKIEVEAKETLVKVGVYLFIFFFTKYSTVHSRIP